MRHVLMGDIGCVELIEQLLFPYRQTDTMPQLPCQDIQAAQGIDRHAVLALAAHLHKKLPHMHQFKRQLRANGSLRLPVEWMALRGVQVLAFRIAISRLCRTLELFVGKKQQVGG